MKTERIIVIHKYDKEPGCATVGCGCVLMILGGVFFLLLLVA